MLKLMEKSKGFAPEDWQGAYNWDERLVPPEIEFVDEDSEDSVPPPQ